MARIKTVLNVCVIVLVCGPLLIGAADVEIGECRSALGMEEGRIPDHAISASSSYEAKSVGPQNARESTDYEPYDKREVEHQTNRFETLVHLVKALTGTGVLAMPQAYLNSGLLVGTLGVAVTIFLLTFCLHLLVLSIELNMKEPRHWRGLFGILNQGMFIVGFLSMFTGFFGYWRYGEHTESVVTLNINIEHYLAQAIRVLFCVAICLSYPLQAYPAYEILWLQYVQQYMQTSNHRLLWDYTLRTIFVLASCRIRQEKNGGAWCPKAQISSEVREYLEVDLVKNHLITWTETQGRFGNGQGQEYAEAFLIEYWRTALDQWVIYKDSRGEKVLTGNKNTYLVVKQRLELPFVASKVRFIPYSEHPRTVCMRVELYGCTWEQSIVRYTASKGDSIDGSDDPATDLADVSYDGFLDGGIMRGGLGQLVDGLYGDDDFQRQIHGENSGSRWVGWSNASRGVDEPLEITFEFDGAREFSAVHLHVNNMFSRGVQVFSSAHIYFSLEGERFKTTPVVANIPADKTRESARNVTILLHGHVARFLRIRLHFASKWLLLSEVAFESSIISSNYTDDMLDKYYREQSGAETSTVAPGAASGETTHARKEVTPATSPTSHTQAYIGLITGVLAMLVLLLACTVFLMIRRGRKKVALLHKHTALVSSSTKPGVTINMKDLKMNMSTPIINNGLASRSRLSVKKASTIGTAEPKVGAGGLYGHVAAGEESDSENSSVYHEPYKLLPSGKQEYGCLLKKDNMSSSKSGEYTDFTSVNSFQEEVKFSSASFYNLTPPPPPVSRPPPQYDVQNYQTPTKTPNGTIPSENYYAATDIIKSERREQHFTPGRFTPIKLPEGPPLEGVAQLLDFPRHRLRLLEKLGEGSFGMIHLCEAEGLPDFNGGSSFHKKQLVIVKSLWRGCGDSKRHEFLRETSWLAGLRDPNLARVVGLCSQDEPMCAFLEHSELGELPRFLALRVAAADDTQSALSYGCLIYLATQVASGMKYLESLDLVHRDLAARNCVIDKNFTVKVSDHAMYCDRYEGDYYISDTKSRLPIRWMSWEALLLGKQTTKSDVWAFAVTLWEVLMLCTQQPYAELTSEQVVENTNHWYQNDGCQRYLPRPAACPREIYDLMGECWKRHAVDRPRFAEIHLFLQRKNLGYIPAHA